MPNSQENAAVLNQIVNRLERLEVKADGITRAMIEIAKTEEHVVRLTEADNEKTKWLRQLQDRVVDLEKFDYKRHSIERWVQNIIWLFFTSGMSLLVAYLAGAFN